jgi:lantibiotic modifying enzyme
LHRETGDAQALDRVAQCGQHLLAQRLSAGHGRGAWKTVAEQPLTGFSHGAAGIAYALLRLYAATTDRAYLAAACEGISYERSVFSEAAGNWPDFRAVAERDGQLGFMISWCHGAPGIGLARLGGLPVLATEEIFHDIEVALHTTQACSLAGVDHLCCSSFGRAEVLLVAAEKLARPELRDAAQKRAAWAMARAAQTGADRIVSAWCDNQWQRDYPCGSYIWVMGCWRARRSGRRRSTPKSQRQHLGRVDGGALAQTDDLLGEKDPQIDRPAVALDR